MQLFHAQPHERAQKERHEQGDGKRKKCRQREPDYQDRQAEKYNEIKEIDYKPFLLFNIQQTFLPDNVIASYLISYHKTAARSRKKGLGS